ncbi:polysaccharide deacetylase family protein [Blastochloris viridis]|uniref:Chitooligosaccharide deacetylase n=1 Tax=Blastochloris viridis TaxID=1079 RepID=A0A0H5BFF1_BLAVI|nr:polysaccharide deacetylase family protein [Blastochloris viridis]ALK09211.1 Peptidoglycan-N-acetylglucosamine deacetylase [Blastochloris viridis]BAS00923.1 polysaccharide deacetylase [Blastochloris viridis]CUU41874.1 putative polysaccharide deacetylase pdaA precursor [Blastochloris viridis]
MKCLLASAAAVSIVASLAAGPTYASEECPGNPDALGTSRVVAVDPATLPRVGFMQYKEMVELKPKEVILTFDDGPLTKTTSAVLETLRKECVKATFFIVGRMAKAYPAMLRQVAAEGHSIATHSVTHPLIFPKQSFDKGKKEIDDGFTIVNEILAQDGRQAAPWFRFPGLGRTAAFEKYLAERGIVAMSADFPIDDWLHRSADQVYNIALARLEANGKGMFLMHDIQPSTVAMLPRLLRTLKERGYKVVHMVPLGTPNVEVAQAETRVRVPSMAKQPATSAPPLSQPVMPMPVTAPPIPKPANPVLPESAAPAGPRADAGAAAASDPVLTSSVPLASQELLGRDNIVPLRRDEMPFSVFWPSQVMQDLRVLR